MSEKKEFISTRQGVKYLDLFAGAGGFSEGFMQAYTDDKYYDFRLASDINENCELTHLSLIHISEPTRHALLSRMPSSA